MDEYTQKKVNKLAEFAKSPELAVFDELQQINESLAELCAKEMPDFPAFPDIPEPIETDLSETNALLKSILDKEDEPVEISVELIIT